MITLTNNTHTCPFSIFSFFPPVFTLRRYQRTSLATTCAELGVIYCAVVSYASDANPAHMHSRALGHSEESGAIVARLIAVRGKLGRLKAGRVNVKYEVSLRCYQPTPG